MPASCRSSIVQSSLVGTQITIQGAQNSNFDGTVYITSTPTPTTFTYTPLAIPPSSASDADMTAVGSPQIPILKITSAGTTATATMGQPLGLSVGSTFQVTVSGASPSVYDGTFNATYEGSNVFQYTLASSPGSNASGTIID